MNPTVVILAATLAQAAAASPIEYRIAFPDAAHHEARITVTFRDLDDFPFDVRMSRSSPGRYRLHEFAKNVYGVSAADSESNPLTVVRSDPHVWTIPKHDGTVTVTYTLFADLVNGTYSAIDTTHAHLNAPATFMWAPGLEERPIKVHVEPFDDSWSVATQLPAADADNTFEAPNLQYLMDSPIEIGDFTLETWKFGPDDAEQTFRLAMHHTGTAEEVACYARMIRAVVAEQAEVFGELPRFDYGTYTFIADYLPYGDGDAMEHRNSTVLCSKRSLRSSALGLLVTASHEFFHVWNVERLRPRSLEPFDFTRANPCGELWFAEGFTNYYDGLILHRAGLCSIDRYARDLTSTVNRVVNSPATRFASVVEMSQQAPLADRAVWADPRNDRNTFLSYYTFGDAVGLALDLTLRTRTDVTLDDFMQVLWQEFGRDEIPYTNGDLEEVLGRLTTAEFAREFFENHIHGLQVADYKKLLRQAGFALRKAHPGEASLGEVRLVKRDSHVVLDQEPLIDRPLYQIGLGRGDRILRLDGEAVSSAEQVEEIVGRHKPGDELPIEFEQRLRKRDAIVQLEEDREVEVVPIEHTGRPLTENTRRIREGWLGGKSDWQIDDLKKRCPNCNRSFRFDAEHCSYDGEELEIDFRKANRR